MKRFCTYSLLFAGGLLFAGLCGCDTEKNTEDPDLDYFVKYYGGDGNQYGVDMLALADGSFLLLGNYAKSTFDTHIYLLRVSEAGDIIWETRFGQPDEIWTAKDLEPSADGNFIVLADYKENLTADTDIQLLKFSPDGTLISSRNYGTAGNESSRTVTPLSDEGFIVSGTTDSTSTWNLSGETDPDLGDIFNLRVDANLSPYSDNDWSPLYHGYGSNTDVAVKILPGPSSFYVFGYTNSTLAGDLNPNERLGLFYFERTAPEGSLGRVWYPGNIITVNDTEINHVQSVGSTHGGGFLIIGTSQNNVGISEIFMARMRPSLTFSNPLSE